MNSNFKYVKTLQDYTYYINYLKDYDSLGLDTETFVPLELKHLGHTALDCHVAKISLLQIIGHKPTPTEQEKPYRVYVNELSDVIIFDLLELNKLNYDKSLIIDLLTGADFIVGVNIQFDLKFLYNEYGLFFDNSVCLRAMSLLIGNATGSKFNKVIGNSFKSLCRDYLNIHLEDKGAGSAQTTDWYTRPTNEIETQYFNRKLEYAAKDVLYLFPLWVKLYNTICLPLLGSPLIDSDVTEDECGLGMYQVYLLEMRVISVMAEMEYNGLYINKPLLQEIEDANRKRLTEVTIALANYLGVLLPINRFTSEPEVTEEIISILNSPKKLINIINKLLQANVNNTTSLLLKRTSSVIDRLYHHYENNKDAENTEEENTFNEELFVDETEADFYKDIINRDDLKEVKYILSLILEYKQISKQLSSSFIDKINPHTNCIHSNFNSLMASTGRTSSSKINLQSVNGKDFVIVTKEIDTLFDG